MTPSDPPNLRHSPRVSLQRSITVSNSEHSLPCQLLDLSYTGLGLISLHPLKKGAYQLNFSLPDFDGEHPLSLLGQMIHFKSVRDQYLIGFKLPSLTPHEQLVFKGFMQFHKRLTPLTE
ncbi:MAG: PilZ domain-containing protein [Gammaproteobacteria bacterium]|nr:PilZ domain-containing protein [Gammaproteobacteria bacterium]